MSPDTLHETPYKLVFGRDAPSVIDLALLPDPHTDDEEAQTKVKIWKTQLEERIAKQQATATAMQRAYEESLLVKSKSTTTEIRTFDIGDKVMLRRHTNVRNLGNEDSEEMSTDSSPRTRKNTTRYGRKPITHR